MTDFSIFLKVVQMVKNKLVPMLVMQYSCNVSKNTEHIVYLEKQ